MAGLNQDVAVLAKKKQASKTWMVLDNEGEKRVLEVDKYAIMHRVGIHARDLRILDPLLSYPSTILGRERAIVLNLEHIKAIITADEVFLRNPADEFVIPFVEELCRRLPTKGSDSLGHEGSEGEGKELDGPGKGATWSPQHEKQDDNTPGKDAPPFEFRALEVALEAICSFLDARTTELETNAYPALDELTKKISSRNLDRVRKLKSSMTRLNARVQKVRDELEQLLDDDDDMADLFLTRKRGDGSSSPTGSSDAPTSPTIASRASWVSKGTGAISLNHGTATATDSDDVEELEMLLEIDSTLNKLTTLREYIDDTEDYINIQLDNHRNQLIQLELILSSATVVVALFSLVAGIFGMNIPYEWNENHEEAFTWVVVTTTIACLVVFIAVLGYARYKHLIGT
ncbi:magnesium transporter MRS2-I isoform X2 [Physcomitrium patens]|uniref:Magnesium transporter n=1 Tax=Physcomitrium patens TaxID=3218 RepID=A0A7I4D403_PHYPA|nr:magnesium transporter MRS2-I-like isoform X2 [Physcomitrium patens]|eukprot:XP_024366415.1 magnesium transporter MRS2-I-like isoform X2 [Physcomitrella patens]